jgi:hypothetical protein
MGQCAGVINDIKSADEILSEMVQTAIIAIKTQYFRISKL